MKKYTVVIFLITMLFSSQVFSCGSRNSSSEVKYTTFLLSDFFSGKMSRKEACLAAESISDQTNDRLRDHSPGVSVYEDTQYIYNHLFTGSYMRKMKKIIADHMIMKGIPKKEATSKAKLLYKVLKAHSKRNKDKWLFQITVLVPYAYNVHKARNWANTTDRFSKKGKRMKGCGSMICN